MNLKILTQKVSYHLRCAATDVLCKTGARELVLREQAGARILLYQGIDQINNTQLNARFHYRHPVSIQGEIFEYHKGEYVNAQKTSLKNICKRKDWTFKSSIYTAFPELISDPICSTYEPYWKVMNETQIRQLAASPWASIGSHGYYHDDLGKIPTEEAIKLLRRSKDYLEEVLDQAITSLAYPNGSYTPALIQAARALGFEQQFIVDYQQASDQQIPDIRPRLTVNPFVSLDNQIRAILRGDY